MTGPAPIVIEAQALAGENQSLLASAELLSECLGKAGGQGAWPVRLQVNAPGAAHGPLPPSVLIVSLLHEMERLDEPIADTEARWEARLASLAASGTPVFLRNIFRHVPERARDGSDSPVIDRIRRLNRMAIGLSNRHGVGVIDIDRACAHLGGRALQTDWRLGGALAAEVAGHTTVWSLLSYGLDDAIDPDLQERARTDLGPLNQIGALLNRRLKRQRARQAAGA